MGNIAKKDNFLKKMRHLEELADKVMELGETIEEFVGAHDDIMEQESLLIPRIIMEVMRSNKHSWIEKMIVLSSIETYLMHGKNYYIGYKELTTRLGITEAEIDCFFPVEQTKCHHPNQRLPLGEKCECIYFMNHGFFCIKIKDTGKGKGVSFSTDFLSENLEYLNQDPCLDG